MTPEVTAARAEKATTLGLATLIVQFHAAVGQHLDADVQTDHLAAAAQHGYQPRSVATSFDALGAQVAVYLLERVAPA